MIIVNKWLVWFLSLGFVSSGDITLYPFLCLTDEECKTNKELMNHAFTHYYQSKWMLVIPFMVMYTINYAILLVANFLIWPFYRNYNPVEKAYQNIEYEIRARAMEKKYPAFPKQKLYMEWWNSVTKR